MATPNRPSKPPPPTLDELLGRNRVAPQPAPEAPGAAAAAAPTAPAPLGTPAPVAPAPVAPAPSAADAADAAARQRAADSERRLALVDGSNVAHFGGERARLRNILSVREKLTEEGYEPIVVADAALRHQIDDPDGYERLVQTGTVQQAPAGTDADYFILSFAKELDASIVSNDQFRDRSRQFSEVRKRVVRFMIVQDEVVFERRTHKRKDR